MAQVQLLPYFVAYSPSIAQTIVNCDSILVSINQWQNSHSLPCTVTFNFPYSRQNGQHHFHESFNVTGTYVFIVLYIVNLTLHEQSFWPCTANLTYILHILQVNLHFSHSAICNITYLRNFQTEMFNFLPCFPNDLMVNPYDAGGQFCQYEMMQKSWKMTEILAHGYSSESTPRELSSEYQHDRV